MWMQIILLITLAALTAATLDDETSQLRAKRLSEYGGGGGGCDDTYGGDSGGGCKEGEGNDNNAREGSKAQSENQPRPTPARGNAKQRASSIAVKAAEEAKQANDDMSSAVQVASQKIKLEYADRAAAAAKAAEAVLAGKAQVLEQLEMEVREAEIVVQEESQAVGTAESNSQLALKAASQAKEELQILLSGLKIAKDNFESSDQVSGVCQQSLADKTSLLDAARSRVGVLLRQLSEARCDYSKTKKASSKACAAAQEAKQRIERQRRRAWQQQVMSCNS